MRQENQNGADRRRVGRRPPDAVFLQRPDQGSVSIPGRRLGEVLSRLEVQTFETLPLGNGFTANMEKELDNVESGSKQWKELLQDFYGLPLGKGRQLSLFFLLLLVLALLIDGGVPGEFQTAAAGPEGVDVRLDLHGHRVIDGVGHLAGHEPVPDQPVQPVLVPGKVLLHPPTRPRSAPSWTGST